MPQVTVYIREDDLDKWKSIEKKSEFISEALNNVGSITNGPALNKQYSLKPEFVKSIKSEKSMLLNIPGIKRASDLKTCKKCGFNLNIYGKCSQKGCK